MICNIQDPITQQDYTRDPRNIARKAVSYMKSTGLADTAWLAPELEFFVFDNVRFDQNGHEAYYHVDSAEGDVEPGQGGRAEPRVQGRLGARLFPLPADRQPGRPPDRDGPADGRVRHLAPPPITTRSPPAASPRST